MYAKLIKNPFPFSCTYIEKKGIEGDDVKQKYVQRIKTQK